MKNETSQPKSEIYQRFFKREIIKTKKNKLLEVKRPVGVFVARKTNKGNIVVSLSLVHKNDKFNMKDGVNQARKNAKRTGDTVNLSNEHSAALGKFIHRAEKYFRVKVPQENPNDWTGKIVDLLDSEENPIGVYYKVVKDNGERVDVVHIGSNKNGKPNKCVYKDQFRDIFSLAE